MSRSILKLAAWAALAAIVLIALSPSGTVLQYPSSMGDRAFLYAVMAVLFVLAYPRSILAVLLLTSTCAVSLEIVQSLLMIKSTNAFDLLPKLAGISLGMTVGIVLAFMRQR